MDCGIIVLGLLFEPDIGEFSSADFTVRSLDNKEITFHAKNGVIVMEKNSEGTPKFQQEFHYPSYGIPKDIRDTCENLRTVAELFGETKFSKFEMDWGYNDETNPYLLRFTKLELAQGKQLKPQFNEAMVFASLQKYNESDEEEEVDESKCYMGTKSCTEATRDFDKKKFIESTLENYTASIQSIQQRKETKANIMYVLQHVCPEMLEGTIRLCPNCYKKITEQKEKRKQQQNQMHKQHPIPIPQHKNLFSTAPVPRSTNTQKISGRASCASSSRSNNNDIFLSQRDYKSGVGYLRPTQKISYYSYKRASKIYLSTSGFPSLNQYRPRK